MNRFPRAQRGLLGRVILDDALQMLVSLTVANRRRDRSETLAEASGRLDALRITLRLSQRLGFLSNGGYAQLSEGADEIGRMLGGWMKHDIAVNVAPSQMVAEAIRLDPGLRRDDEPEDSLGGLYVQSPVRGAGPKR